MKKSCLSITIHIRQYLYQGYFIVCHPMGIKFKTPQIFFIEIIHLEEKIQKI